MGVQTVEARSVVRFSTTSSEHNRKADLTLKPCQEGVDFSLELVKANRMSKVVEIDCGFDEEEKKSAHQNEELTPEDVSRLFQAIGGTSEDDGDDEDDGDFEDIAVSDEYQPTNLHPYTGLPLLESLTIVGREATPSFIEGLTKFLGASTKFPRFTRLVLQGVNLRGGTYELRGMAEAFRLHPHVNNVQMASCWFTPEQQENMNYLEEVFCPRHTGEPKSEPNLHAQKASIRHMKQLVLLHQPKDGASSSAGKKSPEEKEQSTRAGKPTIVEPDDPTNEGNWLERLLKSCLCWW